MKEISWFDENSQRIREAIFEEVTIAKMKLYENLIKQDKDGPDAVEYIYHGRLELIKGLQNCEAVVKEIAEKFVESSQEYYKKKQEGEKKSDEEYDAYCDGLEKWAWRSIMNATSNSLAHTRLFVTDQLMPLISAIYGTPEEVLERLDESLNLLSYVSHHANSAVLTAINLATGLESCLKCGGPKRL